MRQAALHFGPLSSTSLSEAIEAGVVPRASAFSGSARADRRARQILRCLVVLTQIITHAPSVHPCVLFACILLSTWSSTLSR